MKSIKFVNLAVAVLTLTVGAFAGPGHKDKAKVACPVCKMPLMAKKDKANPVAVRLKKEDKVMYCCAKCKMPASVLVKEKKMGKAKAK